MLKWVVCAFGALLTIWGLWWGLAGWSVVEVERGWSSMIAGAIIFASGAVIIAIAALMMRIDALINAVSVRELAAAPPARPEPRAVKPLPPSSVPPPPFPKADTSAADWAAVTAPVPVEIPPPPPVAEPSPVQPPETPAVPEAASVPAVDAIDAAIAAAATAAIASAASGADAIETEAAKSPEIRPPEAPRRPPPALKVIENNVQAKDIASPPVAEKPVEIEASPPAGDRIARRPTVPVPPLAPAPPHAEWPDSPVPAAKPVPPPPMPVQAPRAQLPPRPPMPAGLGGATVATGAMAAAAVETELAKPSVSEETAIPAPEKPGDKPDALGVAATAEAKPAPGEITPTQSDAWVEKLFEELDQIGEAPVGDAQHASAANEEPGEVAAEPVHAEAQHVPEPPVMEVAGTPPATAQTAPALVPAPVPVEEPAPPAPAPAPEAPASTLSEFTAPETAAEPGTPARTLVRKYDSQGVTYHLFDDGSIDAVTSGGTFHFGSLDELRAFIEKRSA